MPCDPDTHEYVMDWPTSRTWMQMANDGKAYQHWKERVRVLRAEAGFPEVLRLLAAEIRLWLVRDTHGQRTVRELGRSCPGYHPRQADEGRIAKAMWDRYNHRETR